MPRFLKALGRWWPFAGRTVHNFWRWGSGYGAERDYSVKIGDGDGNSIVSACIQWIARSFPEAGPALWTLDRDGVRTRVLRHDLLRLLRFPTASSTRRGGYYSGLLLWQATLTSWVLDGNAYWMKVRNAIGKPIQLWYVPHWMMEPRWPDDGSLFISHYDYQVDGQIFRISPDDVVHFRHGLDPNNPRKGRSPLHGVMREIYTDEEAAAFSASILKNLGVPGVVLSPSAVGSGPVLKASADDVETIKAKYKERFSGDNRGEPLIMTAPTDIKQFGFSPSDLDLSSLRNVPEERITAALGIPAAVVGFGAGLQSTKVGATMAELRDQAWQSNLIPTQRLMAEEIAIQLLPDFETDLDGTEFGFDLSRVRVLQEDQGKMAETWARLVSAGIAKRSEARSAFELPSGPEDDTYLPQPGVQAGADQRPNQDQGNGNQSPNGRAGSQDAAPVANRR